MTPSSRRRRRAVAEFEQDLGAEDPRVALAQLSPKRVHLLSELLDFRQPAVDPRGAVIIFFYHTLDNLRGAFVPALPCSPAAGNLAPPEALDPRR